MAQSVAWISQVVAGSTLNNGLLNYWKLDETSGNRADSKGSATMAPSSTAPGSTTGIIGNAATFNGSSSFLSTSGVATLGSTSWSIAGWTNVQGGGSIISKGTFTGSGHGFTANLSVSAWHPQISNGTTFSELTATFPGTGVWVFFFISYDGSTFQSSINNGTMASASISITLDDSSYSFVMGADTNGTNGFINGFLDETGIWNRVLTSSEITSLYNSGSGKTYPF